MSRSCTGPSVGRAGGARPTVAVSDGPADGMFDLDGTTVAVRRGGATRPPAGGTGGAIPTSSRRVRDCSGDGLMILNLSLRTVRASSAVARGDPSGSEACTAVRPSVFAGCAGRGGGLGGGLWGTDEGPGVSPETS